MMQVNCTIELQIVKHEKQIPIPLYIAYIRVRLFGDCIVGFWFVENDDIRRARTTNIIGKNKLFIRVYQFFLF